ncbi:nucleoside triphosphate pyrophosphohydrolase [Candidatus Sumerlaeota bacterium]|nr:nucleoside triphosphate pyrophosphohydrolase [Candidatus Sumerlaeota bacterium]
MTSAFESSLPPDAPENPFDRLCWIMDRLLGPGGCPWDREQTHRTLKQYLVEEAYEVCDAIENEDSEHLKEELGDVALQVVFHSRLAARDGRFDVDDVLETICDKLIRRHPHVFGQVEVSGASEVLENWEEIKKREKADQEKDASLVSGVPLGLPALQKAHRLQEKVARVGFDWSNVEDVVEKVREEFEELERERKHGPPERIFEEIGDLLFSIVNMARTLGVQPEEALQAACGKFAARFRHIERRAREAGRELREMTLAEMDAFWDEAKKQE